MTGPENARSTTGSWIWDGDGRRPFPLRETAFTLGKDCLLGAVNVKYSMVRGALASRIMKTERERLCACDGSGAHPIVKATQAAGARTVWYIQ